ncbi:hypothetical protein D1006_22060 [Burkholderia stabilis]|uniref:Uncharacterized protein n=1 Tax=Burkholderia stabilis TaxID=95485 RepID=A0A4Q2ADW2_9BURK|nr:hypothetical protein [Burkholderia stabilis]RXV67912.1 hypothetical protein D1006_22060 [Burkholderia stabilis]
MMMRTRMVGLRAPMVRRKRNVDSADGFGASASARGDALDGPIEELGVRVSAEALTEAYREAWGLSKR